MDNYFQNSIEHITAELSRIQLKLHSRLLDIRRNNNQNISNEFRGLYIPEKDILDVIGSENNPLNRSKSNSREQEAGIPDTLKELEQEIVKKKANSLRRDITLRLETLKRLFQLSDFDIDVLLMCLLPEINLQYQRVYAYVQDDITRNSPTVNLVLELLCNLLPEKLKNRGAFSPGAPLMKHHLVYLPQDHYSKPTPLLAKSLQIDERISHYLLEIDRLDSRLLPFTQLLEPELKLEDVVLPEEIRQFLNTLTKEHDRAPVCHLYGETGAGKKATAGAICSKLGIPLLRVDLNRMLSKQVPMDILVPLIFREGLLQNAALYLDGFEFLLLGDDGNKPGGDYLFESLKEYPQWLFVASNKEWRPKENWQHRPFVSVELPIPSYDLRKQLWNRYWDANTSLENDVDLNEFASKFRFTGGQIRNVAINLRNFSRLRQTRYQVTTQDIASFCRTESREVLHNMARKIQPRYGWRDIILPTDLFEQLHEIYSYVQYYHRVYSEWGFDKKLSLGKGLNVLFSGPSGTGKTMAAEILAHELQLDLYKIDLSNVVSKYIGETEKNLDRIFKEGQASNAILFFDEADAIFGKRSEVRDAHDRYANIEIAYLLQKMDEYEGMVILATNLRKNIDEAFSRRMHFTLEFPIPDEADRKRIWLSIFPSEAPLDHDIDFNFLARQFQITGGNIKNVALGAAFLAAQKGNVIQMNSIIRAIKREYQKIGKLCNEDDFAGYMEMVK